MPTDVNEVPVVGQMYQKCGIVKKIDEVVKDKGNRIHTRKVITLHNGAMFFFDHYIEKPEEPKRAAPKKSRSFPGAVTRNVSRSNRPAKKSESDHNKIPAKSGHSDSDASALTPRKENFSPEKAKKPVVKLVPATITPESTATGNDSDPKGRDQSNIPLSIIVYSEKDPNLGPANREQVRGIWTFHEESNFDDEELWKPQEIFLYKPGEDLSTIEEVDESSVDTNSLTTGIWGYPKGGAPKAGSEDDWFPMGGEALVVPPQQQAPEDFVPAGKYSFKPGKVSWPPPVDKIKKRLREVGKLEVPKCFEDGKCPIKVFPRSKLAFDGSPIKKSPAAKKKSVSFAPVGQWSYPKDQVEDDDHFLPVDIDLYFGDELPPVATSIAGSEDGSLVSWGLWGTGSTHASPIDVLDDSSEASWELPVGSLIFPPGVEPDADVEIQGRWAFPMNENVKIEWPPAATKCATVYPKMFAPDAESGKTQGVWDFEAIDDADKEEWDPQEVQLFGRDQEFDEEKPHGFWGILQGAEPNEDFDWKPEDVFFCPPGEVPDDDVWVQGKWAFPMERSWPPPPGTTNKKRRSVGKLKIPKRFKGGKTVPMKVFPRSFVPKETHGKRVGKWGGCGKDGLNHLLPQDVELYYGDHEPERPKEPSEFDYGVWGLDEDDVSDVSDPENDGEWSPKNCLVYPPGVAPDAGVRVCGKWTVPGRLKIDWPPQSSKSAWVYPRGVAPAAEACKTQGVWKFVHNIAPEKAHKWQPQQIELYSSMKELDDTRPYGSWGINADAKPDTDLNWDPKDVWFYPPGEEPEANCEKRGIWTFPRGRLDVSWPPPVIESPMRKSRSVGKLKIPGTFDDKGTSRRAKSVGKLKIPSMFSGSLKS